MRASKHGTKGTTVKINKNVDSEFCHNFLCRLGGVFDIFEAKMPRLRGREFKIQHNTVDAGTNTVEELQAGGTGYGWFPIILTQPPNSPEVNINDLGFFSSLKYHVNQICTTNCTSHEEMRMANVIKSSVYCVLAVAKQSRIILLKN
jgi:hypothetical protein